MAFCPKCRGEIETNATVCAHCGYDFPSDPPAQFRAPAFAYSPLADIALLVSSIAAGLGCLVSLIVVVGSFFTGNLFSALIVGPIAFLLQLGMLVVFLRIQDFRPTNERS